MKNLGKLLKYLFPEFIAKMVMLYELKHRILVSNCMCNFMGYRVSMTEVETHYNLIEKFNTEKYWFMPKVEKTEIIRSYK